MYIKNQVIIAFVSVICQLSGNLLCSCLSYNSYLKGTLSASDYMGVVSLYDMNNVKQLFSFEEHEKRCWSVDFSCVDPMRLASGSDDAKGKRQSLST